ncbi:hypothetical protein SPRG_05181 [Saprolegnia parasitica CBS 223.65]|uniref:GAF domain-containing protein n=1 Tax=Saprolegnia parasitica (strain CBS 223.65) TaxID=695850 RepID=A0A067CT63_SAPPC|nr:hypothetical protein SPRG_05181 [Saprolegnia parasitica CBS 223.65]KDO29992.1 hypothetical protein SPRG_05181 [Saprolegnia parasitica CBS 223.65]|eukprot:XP_012199175.1 hypothetical protein SPRG_05181 [Saprolegnia parasitica CBS 223.65]
MMMEQAAAWPADIDLEHMYLDGRKKLERVVTSSMNLEHWTMMHRKHDTRVYKHSSNSSNKQVALRLETTVNMPIEYTLELLRLLDSNGFRSTMKDLHGKAFLDGEVLHAHTRHNDAAESLALKWCAMSTGKAFTKPKELLYYEYCGMHHSEMYGPSAIVMFESYDGVGAQYGLRAKPDTYKLAWFEPSAFIITPSPDGHKSIVTLTLACRKAGGSNLVSAALTKLATRFAQAYAHLGDCGSTQSLVERSNYMQSFHRTPSSASTTRSFVEQPDRRQSADRQQSADRHSPDRRPSADRHSPDRPAHRSSGGSHHSHETARGSGRSDSSADDVPRPHKKASKRQTFVNEDFAEICRTAMQSLDCPMAGIRTTLFEIVQYAPTADMSRMPKSLPTFRRMAQTGKPCVVLDVLSDKRISDEKRSISRVQFFVGVPMVLESGECIGDVCVADVKPRKVIDYTQLEILKVLAQSATAYMTSAEYLAETTDLPRDEDVGDRQPYTNTTMTSSSSSTSFHHRAYEHPAEDIAIESLGIKEVAF